MKKVLLSLVVLGLFAATMAGCRASGSVDPHGSTAVGVAR